MDIFGSESYLVTNPEKFLNIYKEWKGPHHIQQMTISDYCIMEGNYHYLGVQKLSPVLAKDKKWITFVSCDDYREMKNCAKNYDAIPLWNNRDKE